MTMEVCSVSIVNSTSTISEVCDQNSMPYVTHAKVVLQSNGKKACLGSGRTELELAAETKSNMYSSSRGAFDTANDVAVVVIGRPTEA